MSRRGQERFFWVPGDCLVKRAIVVRRKEEMAATGKKVYYEGEEVPIVLRLQRGSRDRENQQYSSLGPNQQRRILHAGSEQKRGDNPASHRCHRLSVEKVRPRFVEETKKGGHSSQVVWGKKT